MGTNSFQKSKFHVTNKKVQHALWGFNFFWHWGQWGRFFWEALFFPLCSHQFGSFIQRNKAIKAPMN